MTLSGISHGYRSLVAKMTCTVCVQGHNHLPLLPEAHGLTSSPGALADASPMGVRYVLLVGRS